MTQEKKTILAVLAHPDDESFGMGGTLAFYASSGADVYLVCATRGEVGIVAPEMMQGYASKGELREAELRCAAEELGIHDVFFLDYRDSGMAGTDDNNHPNALAAQPLEQVTEKVVHYIRKLKPNVVVTFDPVGGYHHPDHIAIHNATVKAFEAAGDASKYKGDLPAFTPEKLFYHIFPRHFMRWAVKVMRFIGKDPTRFGRNQDINLEVLAGDQDYPHHVKIRFGRQAAQKQKAAECHASQLDFGKQSPPLLKWIRLLSQNVDYFMQAYPAVPDNYRTSSLFSSQ